MNDRSGPRGTDLPRYAELGAALRWLRQSRGLSLRALAPQVGLAAHSALVDYERGHRLIPEDLLTGYERVFGTAASRLRALRETALLARASGPVDGPVLARPAELPADLPDFVGRQDELRRLLAAGGRSAAARVFVISGMPGSGKTSLAVHLAHLLRPDCPDGQIYVGLRGGAPPVVSPVAVTRRVLRAWGVPASGFPADEDELLGMYRSVLFDRRMLLVLDNAADEAQVRPLLPAGTSTLVIVTSRNPLPALDGAVRVQLDVLDVADGVALVSRIIGADRVRADTDAVHRIVGWCGGLPLALRVVASWLVTWPDWSLAACAELLAGEHERLARLEFGDRAVAGAFEVSHRALTPPARTLFRRLSLLPTTEFGDSMAAALLGSAELEAERLLGEIVRVGLLRWDDRPDRYRMHDLVRLYAHDRLIAAEDPAVRRRLESAALAWLLGTARRVGAVLDRSGEADSEQISEPAVDDGESWSANDAVRWLDTEREALAVAIRRAGALDLPDLVLPLLPILPWYYDLRCHWDDQRQLADTGLILSRAHHRTESELIALNALAFAHLHSGRFADAADRCRDAIAVARRSDDAEGEAWARDRLGMAWCELGEPAMAVAELRRAAVLAHTCGAWWEEAAVLNHLGFAQETGNQPKVAIDTYQRAAAEFTLLGDDRGEAMARMGLGRSLREVGLPAGAAEQHERAVTLLGGADDRWGVAMATYQLALARRDLGDTDTVAGLLRAALTTFARHHDLRRHAAVLRELADLGQPG